jgi:hypothetical protein
MNIQENKQMLEVWNSRDRDFEASDEIFVLLLIYLKTTFDHILYKQVEVVFVIFQKGKLLTRGTIAGCVIPQLNMPPTPQ